VNTQELSKRIQGIINQYARGSPVPTPRGDGYDRMAAVARDPQEAFIQLRRDMAMIYEAVEALERQQSAPERRGITTASAQQMQKRNAEVWDSFAVKSAVANLLESGPMYAAIQRTSATLQGRALRTDLITLRKRLQKVGEGQQDGHLNDHSRPRRTSRQ
jgi:hypothetical protein